ncbi:MAG: manganese/iron transport system permease protein [Oceanospirillaceae bacterium]|jgi:manganese/iron transport system permease protein
MPIDSIIPVVKLNRTKVVGEKVSYLLEPFSYQYMMNALLLSTLICSVCAFLSAFLILRGWSLIADALSHATLPGVALAYMLGLPFSLGAFVSGGLAAIAILFIKERSILKEDVAIGIIFTSFFAAGLFLLSINPSSIDLQQVLMGNLLAIAPWDSLQMLIISVITFTFLCLYWKDILLVFFDEQQAWVAGINPRVIKVLFFAALSATTLAAMQTVGALLVIAVVVTPGATAYLLSVKFKKIIYISVSIGMGSALIGTYVSYFIDGTTGALIVSLQTLCFIAAFFLSPSQGFIYRRKRHQSHIKNGLVRPLETPPIVAETLASGKRYV